MFAATEMQQLTAQSPIEQSIRITRHPFEAIFTSTLQAQMSSSAQVDISTLKVIDTAEGAFVLRDDNDESLQAIFNEWYTTKQYWLVEGESTAKTAKLKNMKWNTEKSSEIWSVFQQGAMKSDGRPAILCALCLRVYSHSALVGTSTAKSHLTRERHIAKAKEFLQSNQKSELPIDHDALVKKLRQEGRGGISVSTYGLRKLYSLHC